MKKSIITSFYLFITCLNLQAQVQEDCIKEYKDSLRKVYETQILNLTSKGVLKNFKGQTYSLSMKEDTRKLFLNSEQGILLFDKYVENNRRNRKYALIGTGIMIGSAFLIKEKPTIAGIGFLGGITLNIAVIIRAFKNVPFLEQAIGIRNKDLLFPQ